MTSLQDIPKPGEFYRHFKGNLYQVLSIAIHTETEELLVVYQALYGEFQIFARPLAIFQGVTEDGQKRFLKTEPRKYSILEKSFINSDSQKTKTTEELSEIKQEDQELYDRLEKFYDADSYEEKLYYFLSMRGHLNDTMLANIAVSLDIVVQDGSLEEQFQSIVSCLKMMKKYENNRRR